MIRPGWFRPGSAGGIGFGRGSGFESYFSTNMASRMLNINASCYIRIPFRFDGDKDQLKSLVLQMQYDDGFIAYLNGTEVSEPNSRSTCLGYCDRLRGQKRGPYRRPG